MLIYLYIPLYKYIYVCVSVCLSANERKKIQVEPELQIGPSQGPSWWTDAANVVAALPVCVCCLHVCVCVSRVVFVLNWTNFLPVVFYITFCAVFQPPSLPSACCFLTAPLCAFILFVFLYIKKTKVCTHFYMCVWQHCFMSLCV